MNYTSRPAIPAHQPDQCQRPGDLPVLHGRHFHRRARGIRGGQLRLAELRQRLLPVELDDPTSYTNSCKTLNLNLGAGAGFEHIALFQFGK